MDRSKVLFSNLSNFEQNLVILYNIDLNKEMHKLRTLKEQATVDYYLTDMHYLVTKRYCEYACSKELSDEELESYIRSKKIMISDFLNSFLKEGDITRISTDIDYLAKYNELYDHLPNSYDILSALTAANKGDPSGIMMKSTTASVKKHMILKGLGIESYLKQDTKTLNERLRIHRYKKEHDRSKAKALIDDYKARFGSN